MKGIVILRSTCLEKYASSAGSFAPSKSVKESFPRTGVSMGSFSFAQSNPRPIEVTPQLFPTLAAL
jgi:hypothetical protein